jgi:hypothetical protein
MTYTILAINETLQTILGFIVIVINSFIILTKPFASLIEQLPDLAQEAQQIVSNTPTAESEIIKETIT